MLLSKRVTEFLILQIGTNVKWLWPYVLRLLVEFMLNRSVVRGNLKNIRKWKKQIYWSEEFGL